MPYLLFTAVSSHVASDKGPSIDGGKFKFRKTDGQRIGIRFPVFILTYVYSSACHFTSVFQITTKLAAAIFGGALYGGGVLPGKDRPKVEFQFRPKPKVTPKAGYDFQPKPKLHRKRPSAFGRNPKPKPKVHATCHHTHVSGCGPE